MFFMSSRDTDEEEPIGPNTKRRRGLPATPPEPLPSPFSLGVSRSESVARDSHPSSLVTLPSLSTLSTPWSFPPLPLAIPRPTEISSRWLFESASPSRSAELFDLRTPHREVHDLLFRAGKVISDFEMNHLETVYSQQHRLPPSVVEDAKKIFTSVVYFPLESKTGFVLVVDSERNYRHMNFTEWTTTPIGSLRIDGRSVRFVASIGIDEDVATSLRQIADMSRRSLASIDAFFRGSNRTVDLAELKSIGGAMAAEFRGLDALVDARQTTIISTWRDFASVWRRLS